MFSLRGEKSQSFSGIAPGIARGTAVNTGRKIPKTPIEKSPVLQAILIMPALQSGVLRP